ncbi:phage protein Gp27 family protein [Caulobacter soli]|uniref:phage protein Gp27 family protein n=1 Tax=Caulobacter soli TaxID=2708539 RepID=UPI0013E9BEC1|nr:phage protein Gp27 family protein [Caulobacter soli]
MAPGRKTPSSIDRLPDEIQELIASKRRGGATIDQIMEHLDLLNVDVSRSAVGRHVKTLAEIGEDLRRTEALSRFIVEKFGDEPDERVARASMRILQGVLMNLMVDRPTDEEGLPIGVGVDEANKLALSLQRVMSAQRMDTERQIKIRAMAKAEALEEAAKAVDQAARKMAGGMTKDTIAAIKSEILGVGR